MFERIELARPAKAALHFVGDPQHAILVAQRPQLLPIFGGRRNDAAAALHCFKHNGADGRIGFEQSLDRVNVAERHFQRVLHQLEVAPVKLAVGDGEHALGFAVE